MADLDSFLRGLALWLNEGIETGQWGNGAEEAPYSTDCENWLLSEILKDDSIRERARLKSLARHAHLDVDGMEVDAEDEDSGASGELQEVIVGDASKPVGPITVVTGILWRVEGVLKEADTRMQEGDAESR
jgi:hypothetical protein